MTDKQLRRASNKQAIIGLLVMVAVGCSQGGKIMTTEKSRATDEAEIRQIMDDWAKAFRAKDVEGFMSLHAPEIVSFDIVPPLQYVGKDAYRKPAEAAFAAFQTLDFEMRDLSITAGDDVAFSHSLSRMIGMMKDGRKSDYWLRQTTCFRKINGKWLITHDQTSVPTDFESGKAVLDLTP